MPRTSSPLFLNSSLPPSKASQDKGRCDGRLSMKSKSPQARKHGHIKIFRLLEKHRADAIKTQILPLLGVSLPPLLEDRCVDPGLLCPSSLPPFQDESLDICNSSLFAFATSFARQVPRPRFLLCFLLRCLLRKLKA